MFVAGQSRRANTGPRPHTQSRRHRYQTPIETLITDSHQVKGRERKRCCRRSRCKCQACSRSRTEPHTAIDHSPSELALCCLVTSIRRSGVSTCPLGLQPQWPKRRGEWRGKVTCYFCWHRCFLGEMVQYNASQVKRTSTTLVVTHCEPSVCV